MFRTKRFAVLAMAAGFAASAQAQSIDSVEVTGNIHMLTGDGGNLGLLLGDDGPLLIDDKFAPLTEAIIAKIGELGGDTPRFVVNTHFHGDHTGGNENFGNAGSTIVAHDNVRGRLAEGTEIKAFGMVTPPQTGAALPVITFTRDVSFHLNGERVDVIHVPNAHTDGDGIVHFPGSNVIHAGDVFFNGFFPFIDVDHGGTVKGTIEAADRILALADESTRIIPGHGPLAGRDDLLAYRDMLATAHERLSALKAEGKSAEEAAAANPLADLDEKWGQVMFSSERWIGIVYGGI